MFEIFKIFFALGWVSFGGPAAHIGYFRQTFVEERAWLSDEEYAQLVALSQFLPGPGSSQVGFALGYQRGGLSGACAAFIGFTLPSVLLMLAVALLSSQFLQQPLFQHIVHGLKLLAVMVVADATWGMFKNFCQHKLTLSLCLVTAIVLLVIPSLSSQMLVLIIGALIGALYLKQPTSTAKASRFSLSWPPLVAFLALFFALPLLAPLSSYWQTLDQFYQAGSLVFGGGHVVLPLLQNSLADNLTTDTFLTGYAAAQAVPGPMFTLATFLGFVLHPETPVVGALLATLAIFLPGFLLLLGVIKNWQALSNVPAIAGALKGVNACVVGLLLAALYQPVFTSAVADAYDLACLLIGFILLKVARAPILVLVLFFALAGILLGFIYPLPT
ncbi:chromate efflux transporter [Vibrio sp. CDRSL-10 TSBA]